MVVVKDATISEMTALIAAGKEEARILQEELASMISTLEAQTAAQAQCEERRLGIESQCRELELELQAGLEKQCKAREEMERLVEAKVRACSVFNL